VRINDKLALTARRFSEQGFAYTINKLWVNAVRRPVSSRIHYRRYGDRYPTNLIFVAGQAKGGSTWFCRMFASLPGFELLTPMHWKITKGIEWNDFQASNLIPGIFDEFRRKLAVIKAHSWGFPENVSLLKQWELKHLISVRDPRDILISNYYYAINHPENWDHGNAKGVKIEDYLQKKLESGDWNRQFVDWGRSWVKNRDPELSLILKYEDALEDPIRVMTGAFDFLGFDLSKQKIERIVEANTFEKMSGRKPGEEDVKSFQRKGVSGEWREVFTDEQKRISLEQAGDVLTALGYSTE
jgi:hypothetical protein